MVGRQRECVNASRGTVRTMERESSDLCGKGGARGVALREQSSISSKIRGHIFDFYEGIVGKAPK